MGYRLYQLQVQQGTDLLEKAQAQQSTIIRPVLPRRTIIDREGNVLALDQVRYSLFAHPVMFSADMTTVATALAPLLQEAAIKTDVNTLLQQFSAQETGIPLGDSIPEGVADQIRNLGFDGLDLTKHQQRSYPFGDLYAQILGYVDWNGESQGGLEASELDRLQLTKPDREVRRMGNGVLLPDNLPQDFLHTDDLKLQLTLDSRLQQAAQTALQQQLDKFSAKRGAVIIMDVQDGAILSLATLPTYDANRYFESNVEYFRNWALSDLYEPGSTFKPLNVAIALELGGIRATDAIYDEGQIQVGGWPIANHDFETAGGHGTLSIAEVLKFSSNVGMVHIVSTLDPSQYYDYLQKLGIGQDMDTDLPNVATGYLKDKSLMVESAVDRATTAFGQGLTVTPLQMVQLHGALANGGRRVTPHVIAGLVDSQGQFEWTPDYPSTQIFKPETTRQVLDMMELVVRDGTKAAVLPGYRVGGKTGTAQKAENGIYIPGAKITSFVGIVPIEQPRYVVFAVVDEPQGANTFGSTVAAPVVRQVMESLTVLKGIQPQDPEAVGKPPQEQASPRD